MRRARSTAGLSFTSLDVLAGTGLVWFVIGAQTHAWAILLANALWFVFHLLLCVTSLRIQPTGARNFWLAAGISGGLTVLITIPALVWDNDLLLTLLVVGLSLAYTMPALWRGLRSATTRGLSVLALMVNSIEGAFYVVAGVGYAGFGVSHLVPDYLFFGGIALLGNLPRLIRVGYRCAYGLDMVASQAVKTR